MTKAFKTKEELRAYIAQHIPIGVLPARKSKYVFIFPYSSNKAKEVVIEVLTEKIWEKIDQN